MIAHPRVLSIAGTDPSGGAGIQADLKSIAANRGYGMAAVTALVAQNTQGVRSVFAPPASFLEEQLCAVSDDVTIDAVKIGMLFNAEIVEVVHHWLRNVAPPIVVIDPVMIATSGDRLLQEDTEAALRALLSTADLITPNTDELAALTRQPLPSSWEDALQLGQQLARDKNTCVLVKGGHLTGVTVSDALVEPDGTFTRMEMPRVITHNTHGTGCSLSSALATNRARLGSWTNALDASLRWMHSSLTHADALEVGRGHGPISHMAELWSASGTISDVP